MTVEEFIALPETEPATELIDGYPCQKPVGTKPHSRATWRLGRLFDRHPATAGERRTRSWASALREPRVETCAPPTCRTTSRATTTMRPTIPNARPTLASKSAPRASRCGSSRSASHSSRTGHCLHPPCRSLSRSGSANGPRLRRPALLGRERRRHRHPRVPRPLLLYRQRPLEVAPAYTRQHVRTRPLRHR